MSNEMVNTAAGTVPDPSRAVDLGLPSGTKWAPWNVGASRPSEPGGYFAWGETTADKRDENGNPWYYWDNYKFISDRSGDPDDMWKHINKYQVDDGRDGTDWFDFVFIGDGKKTLDPEDDAATANWGWQWKMPTVEQFQELLAPKNCIWEWKQRDDGTAGYVVTSLRNGNRIFLPAAGARWKAKLNYFGSIGEYWSSELYEGYSYDARDLYFYHNGRNVSSDYGRCGGRSVRPVLVSAE